MAFIWTFEPFNRRDDLFVLNDAGVAIVASISAINGVNWCSQPGVRTEEAWGKSLTQLSGTLTLHTPAWSATVTHNSLPEWTGFTINPEDMLTAMVASEGPDGYEFPVTSCDFEDDTGPVEAYQHWNPDGTLGGWVAATAHVAPTVFLFELSTVTDAAQVEGNVELRDTVEVSGNAKIKDNTKISGAVRVFGNATVTDDVTITGKVVLKGDVKVSDNASLSKCVVAWGDAQITGDATATGDRTKLFGNIHLTGTARIEAGEHSTGTISKPFYS